MQRIGKCAQHRCTDECDSDHPYLFHDILPVVTIYICPVAIAGSATPPRIGAVSRISAETAFRSLWISHTLCTRMANDNKPLRRVLESPTDVRFGSLADIARRLAHVRFAPESAHKSDIT